MSKVSGKGRVLENGQEIATVRYDLTTVSYGKDANQQSETEGSMQHLSGKIKQGVMYTLRSDKGIEVEFYVYDIRRDTANPLYMVRLNRSPEI